MQGSWLPIEIDMCCCQEHDAVQFGQIGRLENNPRYALSNGELRNEFSLKTGSTSLRIKIVYFCNWKFKKGILFLGIWFCLDSVCFVVDFFFKKSIYVQNTTKSPNWDISSRNPRAHRIGKKGGAWEILSRDG